MGLLKYVRIEPVGPSLNQKLYRKVFYDCISKIVLIMMVFLGGTVNGSKWRDELIPKLKIDYFNPVVDEWNENAMQAEEDAKDKSDYLLFVLTPKLEGFYSIAEAVDASNKHPQKTVICVLDSYDGNGWTAHQIKSLKKIEDLISSNGGIVIDSLDELVLFLNGHSLEV